MSVNLSNMSWMKITRKEVKKTVRSKSLWAVTTLFVIFAAGVTLAIGVFASGSTFDSSEVSSNLVVFILGGTPASWITGAFISSIALFFTYSTIVGERESGSLRLLLGLPYSRGNVVFGKLIGRGAVISASVLIGFVISSVVILITPHYDKLVFFDYLVFVILSLSLGMIFVSLATMFSAVTKSKTTATAGVISVFFLFQFLWDIIRMVLVFAAKGKFVMEGTPPSWSHTFNRLNPNAAYSYLVKVVLPSEEFGTSPNQRMMEMYGEPLPFHLTEEFAVLVLIFWMVVPALLAYYMFERAEIE